MSAILTLAMKDLRLLLRDRAGFFFICFFPFLYSTFFGSIFGGGGGRGAIGVAAVDEDQSEESRAFIQKLASGKEIEVLAVDRATAIDRVRRGKSVAYILLPEGFGARYSQPFRDGMPQIETGIDPARQAESGLLTGVLTQYLFQGMVERFTDRKQLVSMVDDTIREVDASAEMDPVLKLSLRTFLPALKTFSSTVPESAGGGLGGDFLGSVVKTTEVARNREGPKTSYDISFPQGIIWGLLSCSAGFGISIVAERTKGTLVRLRMAPVGAVHILGGKALACFVTTTGVSTLLLVFARVVFGVRPDSVVLLTAAVVCSSVCFVGLMMLISVLGKTEQSAGSIGWGILTMLAMIGGGMIPLMFMPSWMRLVSHISPIKWAIYSMEGAIWRGFSPVEMVTPCLILVAIGVSTFALGTRFFSWTEQQ